MRIKKLLKCIPLVFAGMLFQSLAHAGEYGNISVGISASLADIQTDGKEILKHSGNETTASISDSAVIPSVFVEYNSNILNGLTIGIDYVPEDANMGSKSVTKTDTDEDDASDTSGTNKADAELTDLITVYLELPLGDEGFYVKAGASHVLVNTKETLATGGTYENQSVGGVMGGVGLRKLGLGGTNAFMKMEVSYTDFHEVKLSDTGRTGTQIIADVDAVQGKISLGYRF